MKRYSERRDRQGATAVELAMVLPFFFLFLFALFEIGHAMLITNMMKSGVRSAARLGSTEGVTSSEIQSTFQQYVRSTLDTNNVTFMVKDASSIDASGVVPSTSAAYAALPDLEVSNAESRQLFVVRASVSYNDVALLPLPFMDGVTISGQTYTRHE